MKLECLEIIKDIEFEKPVLPSFWFRTFAFELVPLGVEFFHIQIPRSALLVWAVESANPKRTQTNATRNPTHASEHPQRTETNPQTDPS